jgi:hypothetical protein
LKLAGNIENSGITRLRHFRSRQLWLCKPDWSLFSDAISNPMWANLYYIAINRQREEVNCHYILSHRLLPY